MNKPYDLVVGLEIHVQLLTASKAFCGDQNIFGASPNTQVSPVSLAYPGVLPVANHHSIELAIRLGLALNSTIASEVRFDRKNYFYPDLPKGYQITQDKLPICKGGTLFLPQTGRTLRIHHIHLEDDAGKLIHDQHLDYTLIDLNRAGVPLLEIVTEPDLRSADEVFECIDLIQKLVKHLDVSDGNMEEGSLRCDCNVSVKPAGSSILGQRCEIKNLNSRRFAKAAVEYEYQRQVNLLEAGETIHKQTLHYDKDKKMTFPLRDKESADDYRYFPDPDLPPIPVPATWIAEIKHAMPALPETLKNNLITQYKLNKDFASIIGGDKWLYNFYTGICTGWSGEEAAILADLVVQKLKQVDQDSEKGLWQQVPAAAWLELVQLVQNKIINRSTAFSTLVDLVLTDPHTSPANLAKQHQLIAESNADELMQLVLDTVQQHPQQWEALRKGKQQLMGLFMGEVMKKTNGKADPQVTRSLLQELMKK